MAKKDKIDKVEKVEKKAADKKKAAKKPNRVLKFFRETITEIKKIVWPTPKTTFKNTGIVLVAMVIVGLVVFGLDTGLMALLSLVMNTAA